MSPPSTTRFSKLTHAVGLFGPRVEGSNDAILPKLRCWRRESRDASVFHPSVKNAYRSEKQMDAANIAAAVNDPKESIRRFGNKKGSPKNSKWSLSSGFMDMMVGAGLGWGIKL